MRNDLTLDVTPGTVLQVLAELRLEGLLCGFDEESADSYAYVVIHAVLPNWREILDIDPNVAVKGRKDRTFQEVQFTSDDLIYEFVHNGLNSPQTNRLIFDQSERLQQALTAADANKKHGKTKQMKPKKDRFFSKEQVFEIYRLRYEEGLYAREIVERVGGSLNQVQSAMSGATYKDYYREYQELKRQKKFCSAR